MNSPIAMRRHQFEQRRTDINVGIMASEAGIHNLRLVLSLGDGIPDADPATTLRVVVRVSAVAHHGDRESDDEVVGVVGYAAGSEARGIVGHVAAVGRGDGGEEESGKGGEKCQTHFDGVGNVV